MTYQEKLKNSTVIKTGVIPKANFGLVDGKKRKRSVLAFLLIAGYTILNKFVFNTIAEFDFLYVVLIVNLISLFILKLTNRSIFELNHMKLYSVVYFISRVCKLIIFISIFLESTTYFLKYFENFYVVVKEHEAVNPRIRLLGYDITYFPLLVQFELKFFNAGFASFGTWIKDGAISFAAFDTLFTNYQFHNELFRFLYREIQIILVIPVLTYFLGINLTYIFKAIKWVIIALIPIYNIYYYLHWLLNTNITFARYSEAEDKKFVKKDIMLLNSDAARDLKTQTRALKFLYSIIFFIIMAAIGYVLYLLTLDLKQVNNINL